MDNHKLRIGLIGTGDFGPELQLYISNVAELVAICDPNPAARSGFVKRTALDLPGFDSHDEMLDKVDMDAVVICSPNFTHKDITVAAAGRGKHVFCEKAMATCVPDCWETVRACQKTGVRLMVGHKRRLRPPWARMIELKETLGEVSAITACCYHDARPYNFYDKWWNQKELSGGTLPLIGVHVVDWMRAICGDVLSVRAMSAPQVDSRWNFPDTLHVDLAFASGAIASLAVSLSYPLCKFRQSSGPLVICKNGGMRLEPHMDHINIHWQHMHEDRPHCERYDDLGFDHAYSKEIGDFVRWVADAEQPCLTWEEGLRCVEVMEAAHRSAEAGGKVIEMPLYPELE